MLQPFVFLPLLLAAPAATSSAAVSTSCKTDADCSLNGVCASGGACVCDAPWKGGVCGILGYKTTAASGRSLYPATDPHNTWNGAIMQDSASGVYHLYNPLFPPGELGGTTVLMHGTADNVTGPYAWGKQPDITIPMLGSFDGPKSLIYPDSKTNQTKFSLWLGGNVWVADNAAGR